VQFSIPSFLGAALKIPGFVCIYAKHFDSPEKLFILFVRQQSIELHRRFLQLFIEMQQ